MHFCFISALSPKVISPPNTFCLQQKRDYIFHDVAPVNCVNQINLCVHIPQKVFWSLELCTREYAWINCLQKEIMRVSKLETLHANVGITELNRMSISLQVEVSFNTDSFESHAEKLHLPLLQLTLFHLSAMNFFFPVQTIYIWKQYQVVFSPSQSHFSKLHSAE